MAKSWISRHLQSRHFFKLFVLASLISLLLFVVFNYSRKITPFHKFTRLQRTSNENTKHNPDDKNFAREEIPRPYDGLDNVSRSYKMWNISGSSNGDEIHVMIPLANAKWNRNLQQKFEICVSSMLDLSSAFISLYVVGDTDSHTFAATFVHSLGKQNVKLVLLEVDALGAEVKVMIQAMQQHFSYQPGSYYSHALFFLSTALHRLAPPSLHRLIMLDADLMFKADIKILHELFNSFSPSNVIGIAYEMQPVYRHVLSKYRQEHPGTLLGEAAPRGFPGFNSGVLLLDLDKMRRSVRYNELLEIDEVKKMTEKYSFKGHLADQDFYTLLAFENKELFYVLPSTWNRQLCQWWKDKGYESVFDDYFTYKGKVNIYHGNCNTPFPMD